MRGDKVRTETGLGRQRGFSLIELMVVVLIIAVLIAIAIPTYLGARTRAQDRSAQAALRNGLVTAKTYFAGAQSFLDGNITTTVATYEELEPSITWAAAVTAGAPYEEVAITVATATDVVLVRQSAAGRYFCIHENVSQTGGGISYASGDAAADVDEAAECAGAAW